MKHNFVRIVVGGKRADKRNVMKRVDDGMKERSKKKLARSTCEKNER